MSKELLKNFLTHLFYSIGLQAALNYQRIGVTTA